VDTQLRAFPVKEPASMLLGGHILFPVDFSPPSLGAAHYASMLARHFHCELTLLHVVEPPAYAMGAVELAGIVERELAQRREGEIEKQLHVFAAKEFGNMPVRRILDSGDPALSIVEFAHRENVGLILMPTHGRGVMRRFILGSVTAKVLHDAESPIFTGVHMAEPAATLTTDFHAVACAVDLGPQSKKALEWANQFASEFRAKLTILHVAPELAGGEDVAHWRAQLAHEAREKVDEIQKGAQAQGDILIDHGNDTPKAVCANALRLKADLLVIGRGSASGATGRLRANAYAIIRQSSCPVVSV
jgi:nucleotide-binding universal stress UspA family protein